MPPTTMTTDGQTDYSTPCAHACRVMSLICCNTNRITDEVVYDIKLCSDDVVMSDP